jgi:hypothetical protein
MQTGVIEERKPTRLALTRALTRSPSGPINHRETAALLREPTEAGLSLRLDRRFLSWY